MVSTRTFAGLVMVSATAMAQSCSFLRDVDFVGNDIKSTRQANPGDCCADCRATKGCNVYNWDQGVCYLKTKRGQAFPAPGTVSGVLSNDPTALTPTPPMIGTCSVVKGVDYPGNDIKATLQHDATKCCSDCQATPGCQLYNWFDGVCYLKSKQGPATPLAGAVSGVVSYKPVPTPAPTLAPNLPQH
ncbi:Aste57867_6701 [Aphanomyces stellatus]|uniref:Aste57867_6701 protein n=1 Tax=Aphanomyces stellatus TaxID=120398 RepID=A0A485KHW6_9STRA|nr:hypothetical protein As57867_006681 [Aphanomyces stellatus]VFT83670.1 Aste57867_6701 [Aphanomyces stellatus]